MTCAESRRGSGDMCRRSAQCARAFLTQFGRSLGPGSAQCCGAKALNHPNPCNFSGQGYQFSPVTSFRHRNCIGPDVIRRPRSTGGRAQSLPKSSGGGGGAGTSPGDQVARANQSSNGRGGAGVRHPPGPPEVRPAAGPGPVRPLCPAPPGLVDALCSSNPFDIRNCPE